MSAWFAAVAFPLSYNLALFDQHLTQAGIVHRFTEEQSKNIQVLWLFNPDDVAAVKQIVDTMSENGPEIFDNPNAFAHIDIGSQGDDSATVHTDVDCKRRESIMGPSLISSPAVIWQFPITLSFITLGIIGFLLFLLAQQGTGLILNQLTFHQIAIPQHELVSVYQDLRRGELWRLITPVFIHFDFTHVAFNCALFWFLGHRIEHYQGRATLLVISLISGVLSNLLQASWYGIAFFGGLSGIVYALVGYIWVWQTNHKQSPLRIQQPIIVVLLVMMVLGFTPILGIFANNNVANGAHLGGVISGIILGFFHSKLKKEIVNPKA